MTNILNLPVVGFTTETPNNGDLLDQICTFEINASPIDISGIAFEAQLRTSPTDSQAWVDASTGNGYLVNGGSSGILSWAIPVSVLSPLPLKTFVTDIRATADGHTIVVATGTVVLSQGVTR